MSIEIFYSSISIENIRNGKKKQETKTPRKFLSFSVFFSVEIIFLVNLRLSFSETIESPDSSISYFIEISQDWVCDPNLYCLVTLTVEILQDLVLHLPFKSVIVFTFNSFLYYIPVIQEFFSTSIESK